MGLDRAHQRPGVVDDHAAPARAATAPRRVPRAAARSPGRPCRPGAAVSLRTAPLSRAGSTQPERVVVVVDHEHPVGVDAADRARPWRRCARPRAAAAGSAWKRQRAVAAVAPDEVGHEVVDRVGEQVGRRGDLREVAADLEHRHLVAELDGLVDVVGDEDDRLAEIALQAQELVLELLAHHRVDGAERLVHQHHRRVGREGTGHPDALLLATGELRRVALGERRVEPDALEQLHRALAGSRSCPCPAGAGRSRRCRGPCGAGRGRRAG